MSAAGVTHQVDRFWLDLFDEGDNVGDMPRHQVIAADAVPVLRKKVPQADGDHAMLFRQRPEYGVPSAEIPERAVHADQRPALSDIEIGHVIAVDAQGLHERVAGNRRGGYRFMEPSPCPCPKAVAGLIFRAE